jgi:hypothetical protein
MPPLVDEVWDIPRYTYPASLYEYNICIDPSSLKRTVPSRRNSSVAKPTNEYAKLPFAVVMTSSRCRGYDKVSRSPRILLGTNFGGEVLQFHWRK